MWVNPQPLIQLKEKALTVFDFSFYNGNIIFKS